MKPRLISCYFGANSLYARMARVLTYTASQHCAAWDVHIDPIDPPELAHHPAAKASHVANTQKMESWYQATVDAPDDAEMLLLDADTVIVQPLDDVWSFDFEFAYTAKDSRFPFNSGVVFLRLTPAVRTFMKVWRDRNLEMLKAQRFHQEWRRRYGGINQASLGYALDSGETIGVQIRGLPCSEWNCEDSSWSAFDPDVTKIVHLKSALRESIFGRSRREHQRIVEWWRHVEAAAVAVV